MVYEHPRYREFLEAVAGLYAEGILLPGYEDYSYSSIEKMMGDNTLGSTMTFSASGAQTSALREAGIKDAYMQCLFAGKTETELTDIRKETYKGLFTLNNDYFYVQPPTIETSSYVKHRTVLITEGVCKLRDKAIRGEITVDEFFAGYDQLKNEE